MEGWRLVQARTPVGCAACGNLNPESAAGRLPAGPGAVPHHSDASFICTSLLLRVWGMAVPGTPTSSRELLAELMPISVASSEGS